MKLVVTSNAFGSGGAIPVRYTCDGAGKAPTLTWSAVPQGTKTIAILVDDPDAERGPFTHLLVTDLPPELRSLNLGDAPPGGANVLLNDTGSPGYLAPCPEDGHQAYHYRVYALDATTVPTPGTTVVTRDGFLRAIEGHVLAEGELVGVYDGG
ncbi:MAG: YbhB/YbcL family Raf kinase inhibitor-like protein [Acidobacteriota bacterium]